MTRSDVLTRRVHPLVYRWLAVISLVLSIPAFVGALTIFQQGRANFLEGTIAAALLGAIFVMAAIGAFKGARGSVRDRLELDQRSSLDDRPRWSSAQVRWVLALFCFAFFALSVIPTAIAFIEWRWDSGGLGSDHPLIVTVVEGKFDGRLLSAPRTPLPPLGLIGGSTFTIAMFAIAVGLISRRHQYVAWGLLLFLTSAVGFMAYECFFRQFLS